MLAVPYGASPPAYDERLIALWARIRRRLERGGLPAARKLEPEPV